MHRAFAFIKVFWEGNDVCAVPSRNAVHCHDPVYSVCAEWKWWKYAFISVLWLRVKMMHRINHNYHAVFCIQYKIFTYNKYFECFSFLWSQNYVHFFLATSWCHSKKCILSLINYKTLVCCFAKDKRSNKQK